MGAIRFNVEMPSRPRMIIWSVCLLITLALCIMAAFMMREMESLEVEAVTLPEAVAAKQDARRYDVIVNIMRDGTYRISGKDRKAGELRAFFARMRVAAGDRRPMVKIRCDADTAYKHVQTVMESCRGVGIYEVSFGVAQKYVPVPTVEEG
jgi:biopolymer transport protein ExbD